MDKIKIDESEINRTFFRESFILLCSSVLVNIYLSRVNFSQLNGIGREYQNRLTADIFASIAILIFFIANYWRLNYANFRIRNFSKRSIVQQVLTFALIIAMLVNAIKRVLNFVELENVWWQVYAQSLMGLLLICFLWAVVRFDANHVAK